MAFISYNQCQGLIFPMNLNDLIPDDYLVRAINDVVEKLYIGSITAKYKDGGRDAFHPWILLKILFYGYAPAEAGA